MRAIDVKHKGHEKVICCWELDGVLIDPGPEISLPTLLEAIDGERPRALLLTHIERTGSPLAASLVARLDRGEDVFGRFTKLVPVDYLSVLALRARCEEDGTDPDGSDAWNTILETTHG